MGGQIEKLLAIVGGSVVGVVSILIIRIFMLSWVWKVQNLMKKDPADEHRESLP